MADLTVHFEAITEILFFLLAAMTIVELIDSHHGFRVLNQLVKTGSKTKLLWVLSILTFFMSSVLDNLTTTIVMMAVLKRFVHTKADLWFFAGFVIIAANAGGAWSPIGDVTTIMLWNGGQVTSGTIISEVLLAEFGLPIRALVDRIIQFQGATVRAQNRNNGRAVQYQPARKQLYFVVGHDALALCARFQILDRTPPGNGHDL